MNTEVQRTRNEYRKYIDLGSRGHSNCIRVGENESGEHSMAKYLICRFLMKNNFEFYTEAKLIGGGRADIFVLDKGLIIEVLSSETVEQLAEKTKKYPVGLDITTARWESGMPTDKVFIKDFDGCALFLPLGAD